MPKGPKLETGTILTRTGDPDGERPQRLVFTQVLRQSQTGQTGLKGLSVRLVITEEDETQIYTHTQTHTTVHWTSILSEVPHKVVTCYNRTH